LGLKTSFQKSLELNMGFLQNSSFLVPLEELESMVGFLVQIQLWCEQSQGQI